MSSSTESPAAVVSLLGEAADHLDSVAVEPARDALDDIVDVLMPAIHKLPSFQAWWNA